MFSAKTEYACVALARLAAEHSGGRPLQGRRLAAEEAIPEGFLVQILQELKRAGLVTSTRGAAGGYRLARPAADVSLGEALDALEGAPEHAGACGSPSPIGAAVADCLSESARRERARLHGVSLAEIVASTATPAPMYHI
ncbi:MAG: Rrf2 family transcriptional regulator [Planctomycetota bacterium]